MSATGGVFISFEGGEGGGKSTQLKLLVSAFEKASIPFIATREPGGTIGAEKIRSLVVEEKGENWSALSETLLFNAARVEHVERVIKPALYERKTVICDRFFDSTLIYQGIGKGLGEAYVKGLHNFIFGNFMPSLTVILDIDPEIGLKRASDRNHNETKFENLDIEFHRKIRSGFLAIAEKDPQRCAVFNANQKKEVLHRQIIDTIKTRCGIVL